LGVGNFQIFDPDHVEESNLNRMVGATAEDARLRTLKTDVMCRVIRGINPEAAVTAVGRKWQEQAELLRDSDVIFACVDSFSEREQLERAARRYLVPYIDVGMDVCEVDDGHSVGGQVALSLPGGLCLRCLGIITDQRLAQEAAKYGAAGDRPQVV
jgi:molybdopterin/thiamine biosynthesis adenylyltransferase